jgi:hypothetical protein
MYDIMYGTYAVAVYKFTLSLYLSLSINIYKYIYLHMHTYALPSGHDIVSILHRPGTLGSVV